MPPYKKTRYRTSQPNPIPHSHLPPYDPLPIRVPLTPPPLHLLPLLPTQPHLPRQILIVRISNPQRPARSTPAAFRARRRAALARARARGGGERRRREGKGRDGEAAARWVAGLSAWVGMRCAHCAVRWFYIKPLAGLYSGVALMGSRVPQLSFQKGVGTSIVPSHQVK